MLAMVKLYAFLAGLGASGAPTTPPDTSLATFPVAYYGANWNRTLANLQVLSRMQIVILMQEDGPCWLKCCPNAREGVTQCGDERGSYHNATALAGCEPDCDQHGWQNSVFERLKELAQKAGRREPHCMMYLNAVYDFPFSSTHAAGDAIDVLDVHGRPHMENVDPGLFPAYFFDFGRAAARRAWRDIVERAVVNGSADGVYVDCGPTYGLKCEASDGACTAKRNGKVISVNEEVTPAQVAAYQKGKDDTVTAGAKMVGPQGTWYSKAGGWSSKPRLGGNLVMIKDVDDAPTLMMQVRTGLRNGYKYVIVGCANCYSNPKTEKPRPESHCSETQLAAFLLAVEPGAFLLCNGWDEHFALPLGLPTAAAAQDPKTGAWSRSFAGGTTASWANGKGAVHWAPSPQPDIAVV